MIRSGWLVACVDKPLTQDVGVGDLELEHRLVLGRPLEVGDHVLHRADEDVQCLELGRVPIGDEEYASTRLRHPGHLTQRLWLVRNQKSSGSMSS